MAKEKRTQEAQKDTAADAGMIKAAAQITGKPAAEITAQEAQEVLFSEIGSSERPPADKEKAMQAAADAIHAQEAQEMTQRSKIKREIQKDTGENIDLLTGALQKGTTIEILKEQAAAGKDPKDLLQTVYALSFIMDYMKDPLDALASYKLPGTEKMLPDMLKSHYLKLVKQVADETGADPEQIADKERRTPEQDRALTEAAGREQLARLELFIDSNYMQALREIAPLDVTAKTLQQKEDADMIKQLSALYFFALHFPDIRPDAPQELTEAQISEIRGILARFDRFVASRPADAISTHFKDFIEKDSIDPDKVRKNLPRIIGAAPESLDYPIDKINSNVWDLLDDAAKGANGQIAFATEKRGSKKEATIFYSIDFDALERLDNVKISKQLTPFDKRVYICVYALYIANGSYMSAGQIYRMMGYPGKPNADIIKKIDDSLTKMGAARVYLDNTAEIQTNKGYTKFKYDAALLPFERVSAYINNGLCESAIHIFREPPLMTFARERKQITTISRKLLESPVNKTEANLRIDDYLIERIARMKSGKGKSARKILYSTLYDKCNITTRKQRQRAPEKIRKFLDHYQKCEWIRAYKEDETGVTIEL